MKRIVYSLFVCLFFLKMGLACDPGVTGEPVSAEPTELKQEMRVEPRQEPVLVDGEPVVERGEPVSMREPALDAGPDRTEPVPERVPEPSPAKCAVGEACNATLTKDGLCPGSCLPQASDVTCRGTVKFGLCYQNPPKFENPDLTLFGLLLQPGSVPESVEEGATVQLTLKVTNTRSSTANVSFSYQVFSHWELVSASFKDWKSLELKSGESNTLTMKLKAIKANVFESNSFSRRQVIAISFGGEPYSFVSTVGYGPLGNNACGSYFFPARYCPSTTGCSQDQTHYYSGKCCGGVFYPGASCCTASDCPDGACYDGKCAKSTPRGLANTLSMGHQRVLIVMSDFLNHPSDPAKLCQNRYNELKETLKLPAFERYFRDLSQAYTGTNGPAFEFVVLAGLNTDDFNKGGSRTSTAMHKALEQHLLAKGCIKNTNEFDKRVLITSMADLGRFTGKANTGGLVTMKRINMYLFAHELAHTYGSTDLYLDQGGKLQWLYELMGDNLGKFGTPSFHVARGEVLWGDSNRNGVIDVFEFAAYPDSLVATDLKAELTQKNSIEISAGIMAMEKGVKKKIFIKRMTIELPEYKQESSGLPGSTLVWVDGPVDLAAIRKKGTIKVRVKASYTFSKSDFSRKTITLSFEQDVPVTP